MKKFLAFVMAIAMITCFADIAAAAQPNRVTVSGSAAKGLSMVGPFDYDSDLNCMKDSGLVYGDTVYYLLLDKAGNPMSKYEAVDKMKIKSTFEMGSDLVDSVSIAKKYVNINSLNSSGGKANHAALLNEVPASGYYYFVAFKTEERETTADSDVIGTLTFNRKSVDLGDSGSVKGDDPTGIEDEIDDVKIDFSFNIFYGEYDYLANPGELLVSDSVDLKWDRAYVLKFDSDDEVDLCFGYDSLNEGTFTVDVSGQGKVYLKYNTDADDDIVAANPGVKMHFLNFNSVKFNRTGEFQYEMEDGAAAYKVVDGQLVEIPGCEYDEADETFYFRTRVLENYIFASAELVSPAVDEPAVEAPTVEVVVDNPSTGVCSPTKGALFK